jgi:hypothetical protein
MLMHNDNTNINKNMDMDIFMFEFSFQLRLSLSLWTLDFILFTDLQIKGCNVDLDLAFSAKCTIELFGTAIFLF